MAVTGISAVRAIPYTFDISLGTASATGTINVRDPVRFSGNFLIATKVDSSGLKASAAGLALQSNPTYDSHGRVVTATALQYIRQGMIRVSGGSAAWLLGSPAYPDATGSGVAAPTGATGVGATWAIAPKAATSGSTFATGIATVVGVHPKSAGTAELDILLMPQRPDYW